MPQRARQSEPAPAPPEFAAANQLHAAAIRLLRSIRVEDRATGLSGPRLSALSVVVFGGPLSMAALAAAEQVQPPTITRLVRELEREGLVERVRDAEDRRVLRVRATARGRHVMHEGRRRRVARLAAALKQLPAADRKLLARAAELIERLARPVAAPARLGSTPEGPARG